MVRSELPDYACPCCGKDSSALFASADWNQRTSDQRFQYQQAVASAGPHPQIEVFGETRVAMGNHGLPADEKVVNPLVVEQPAQFDPVL